MRREGRINVPAEAVMKTQQVGQSTASHVTNAVQISNRKRDFVGGACMKQVNNRVAVNSGWVKEDFTEGDWFVVHAIEPQYRSANACNSKRSIVGVFSTNMSHHLANQ